MAMMGTGTHFEGQTSPKIGELHLVYFFMLVNLFLVIQNSRCFCQNFTLTSDKTIEIQSISPDKQTSPFSCSNNDTPGNSITYTIVLCLLMMVLYPNKYKQLA